MRPQELHTEEIKLPSWFPLPLMRVCQIDIKAIVVRMRILFSVFFSFCILIFAKSKPDQNNFLKIKFNEKVDEHLIQS